MPAHVTEAQLWRAQQIRDSMQHPQTGEVIPAIARMSAFMPVNIVLCYGLLLPQVFSLFQPYKKENEKFAQLTL